MNLAQQKHSPFNFLNLDIMYCCSNGCWADHNRNTLQYMPNVKPTNNKRHQLCSRSTIANSFTIQTTSPVLNIVQNNHTASAPALIEESVDNIQTSNHAQGPLQAVAQPLVTSKSLRRSKKASRAARLEDDPPSYATYHWPTYKTPVWG